MINRCLFSPRLIILGTSGSLYNEDGNSQLTYGVLHKALLLPPIKRIRGYQTLQEEYLHTSICTPQRVRHPRRHRRQPKLILSRPQLTIWRPVSFQVYNLSGDTGNADVRPLPPTPYMYIATLFARIATAYEACKYKECTDHVCVRSSGELIDRGLANCLFYYRYILM